MTVVQGGNVCGSYLLPLMVGMVVAASVLLFDEAVASPLTLETIKNGFHVAERWPACAAVFARIRDQGECNACWALAPADVLRDRLCIRTAYMGSEYEREHLDVDAFPNISVTDVLMCAKYALHKTACTIGGRPQMAWHHFEMDGYLEEDAATTPSEFAYKFPPCNHSIPSTAVWLAMRRNEGEATASADASVPRQHNGMALLPYCRKRKVLPPECPPSLGMRKRQKIVHADRIGGNTGIMDGSLDAAVMEAIYNYGPVQASMTILPALATIPFGPLNPGASSASRGSGASHTDGSDGGYPFVYRCVHSVWLRNMQSDPTAAEFQRQHHAVRILGWGSVPFVASAYFRLFDLEASTKNATAAANIIVHRNRRKGGGHLRSDNASPRAQKASAERHEHVAAGTGDAFDGDNVAAPNNRFRYTQHDIAFPLLNDIGLNAEGGFGGGADVPWIHYWIVANSWGPSWGHGGVFYVQRGVDDCRLASNVMTPTL